MRGHCVVVVLMTVVIATVTGDRHQQELKEHYDHLAYIAEFNCHHPQPRVISVHELFPKEETAHKAFFPDVTVLHRCDDGVGCCPSNHHCRPKHTHSLHLPFKVTYLEHIGKHKKGSWIIDYHTFDNHTECECVDTNVCVPPTEQEETVHIGSSHKPHQTEHHGESHHKPDHHEPDHHSESSHKTEHHSESHHEPEHHVESSHKNEHHGESHHELEHHSESSHQTEHHEEVHHEEVHHEESHNEPDHHSESSHKSEHHEESQHEIDQQSGSSSYKPDQNGGNSSSPEDNSVNSPSFKPEESESSTMPLLVNYVYSSTSTSSPTSEKTDEKDITSFFD